MWTTTLGRAVRAPERSTGPLAASVEAHVARCGLCQATVAEHGAAAATRRGLGRGGRPGGRAPRSGWLERLLGPAGPAQGDARLVACAPALRAGVGAVGACRPVLHGGSRRTPRASGLDLFLLLAPILPVVGVGLAYGPWTDPMYETTVTAPYSSVRLLLLRTGMVLLVTVGLTAAGRRPAPRPRHRVRLAAAHRRPGRGHPRAVRVDRRRSAAALATSGVWLLWVYSLWLSDALHRRRRSAPRQVAGARPARRRSRSSPSLALRAQAYDIWRFM